MTLFVGVLRALDRRVCDQNSNADAFVTPAVRHWPTRAGTRHSVGGDAMSRPTAARHPSDIQAVSVRQSPMRQGVVHRAATPATTEQLPHRPEEG